MIQLMRPEPALTIVGLTFLENDLILLKELKNP